jgi:hypothetical protein
MAGCAELKRLHEESIALQPEYYAARDALAMTSKKDSAAYNAAKLKLEDARRKHRHAHKQWEMHLREHGCA